MFSTLKKIKIKKCIFCRQAQRRALLPVLWGQRENWTCMGVLVHIGYVRKSSLRLEVHEMRAVTVTSDSS